MDTKRAWPPTGLDLPSARNFKFAIVLWLKSRSEKTRRSDSSHPIPGAKSRGRIGVSWNRRGVGTCPTFGQGGLFRLLRGCGCLFERFCPGLHPFPQYPVYGWASRPDCFSFSQTEHEKWRRAEGERGCARGKSAIAQQK